VIIVLIRTIDIHIQVQLKSLSSSLANCMRLPRRTLQ